MAMFPNAIKGSMPYLNGKQTGQLKNSRRSKPHVNGGKVHLKSENRRHMLSATQKIYQVTLKNKKGQTYKCIVKADGTKSLPELCESKLKLSSTHMSMPNLGYSSPSKQRKILAEKLEAINSVAEDGENFSTSLDLRNCGKKEGIFSAFIRIIKEKMGKSDKDVPKKASKPHGKSKRKPRDLSQRKRQRTVSAMSNLDPIEESPNEHEYEGDEDNDSYTHFSIGGSSDTDSSSVASSVSCTIEALDS